LIIKDGIKKSSYDYSVKKTIINGNVLNSNEEGNLPSNSPYTNFMMYTSSSLISSEFSHYFPIYSLTSSFPQFNTPRDSMNSVMRTHVYFNHLIIHLIIIIIYLFIYLFIHSFIYLLIN
jgi:hypothetical protein